MSRIDCVCGVDLFARCFVGWYLLVIRLIKLENANAAC